MRLRPSGDLCFVLLSALVCVLLFLCFLVPRIQINKATRARLKAVVRHTRLIADNAGEVLARAEALRKADPFVVTAALRWYLELSPTQWQVLSEVRTDAGDTEPRGSRFPPGTGQ